MSKQIGLESIEDDGVDETLIDTLTKNIDQHQGELVNKIDDVQKSIEDVAAIDEIAKHMESAPAGVDTIPGKAIGVALEHMLKRHGLSRTFAFEEYGTMRGRAKQSTIAVEALRENIQAIWKKILEAVRAAVQWLKELFKKQNLFNMFVDKKEQDFEHKFKEAKANGHDASDGTIRNSSIARYLNVGGKAPKAKDLIYLVEQHSKLVKEIYEAGGKSELTVVDAVAKCLQDMEHGLDTFQKNLNDGIQACFEIPTSFHHCRNQNHFSNLSENAVVYEAELIFGQQSIFRTGSVAINKAEITDIRCGVGPSTQFAEFDPSVLVFEGIDNQTLIELDAALKRHKHEIRRAAGNRRIGNINYLGSLERKLNELVNHQTDTIRKDTARIGQISKLISRARALMAVDDVHLITYDCSVHSTFLDYMLRCTYGNLGI